MNQESKSSPGDLRDGVASVVLLDHLSLPMGGREYFDLGDDTAAIFRLFLALPREGGKDY